MIVIVIANIVVVIIVDSYRNLQIAYSSIQKILSELPSSASFLSDPGQGFGPWHQRGEIHGKSDLIVDSVNKQGYMYTDGLHEHLTNL